MDGGFSFFLRRIVGLAGGSHTKNLALDGYDQWPQLTHSAPPPRTEVLYGVSTVVEGLAGPPQAGLRVGDFKVLCWSYTIEGINGGTFTGPCSPCPNATDPELKKGCTLYNLAEDPSEKTNIAESNPEKLAELLARLKVLALESVEPMIWDPPFQGDGYYCAGCPKHPAGTGIAVPWLPWCKDNGEDRNHPCDPIL